MYENGKLFTICNISAKQRRAALNAAEFFGITELDIEKSTSFKAAEVAKLMCLTLRYFTEMPPTKKSVSIALGKNLNYCRDAIKSGIKLLKESPDFADKLRDYAIIYNNEYKRLMQD
jgi:hypothetical protein